MRHIRFPLLLRACRIIAFVGVLAAASPAAGTEPSDSSFGAYLDEHLPRWMARSGVPGAAVALIRNGEVVWSSAYGYADTRGKTAMSTDSVCRAESISKSVTAWGVMRLVADGRVDPDAPVELYLGGWRFPDSGYDPSEITVRRLLSGNAGVQLGTIGPQVEFEPGTEMPTLSDHLSREAVVVQEPGAMFMYSNPGFNVLELLVEEVTGVEFASYMDETVLGPLSMDGASYSWQPGYAGRVPFGYELDGTPVAPYVYPASAAGGLFADVDAIARFVSAEMVGPYYGAGGVLKEEDLNLMHAPLVGIGGVFGFVAEAYGFGHFVETLSDGRTAIWHGGQGHGWMTHFHAVPESGDGIVILTNSGRSWPLLARVLADWSRWSGFAPVKFSRITYATVVVWVLTGLVAAASILQIARIARALIRGRRRFAPFGPGGRVARLILALAGMAVIGVVAWRASLPYVFETSIFPAASPWMATSLVVAAIALIASSVAPGSPD